MVAIDEIHHQAQNHNQSGDDITGNGDAIAQAVELLIQGRLHLVVDLCPVIHFAPLRGIAHFVDHEDAMAFHHRAAATDVIGGIGRLRVKL